MLSDDQLLDCDASDSTFAKDTPQENSPRTFTHHLLNLLGISSKEGTETAINNTQSILPIHTHSLLLNYIKNQLAS